MKSNLQIQTLLLILLLVLSPQSKAQSMGPRDTGGGNAFEAEFKGMGQGIYQEMVRAGLTAKQIGFDPLLFRTATESVTVIATDRLLTLDGLQRMALNRRNETENLIFLSNSSWTLLKPDQKRLLVTH